MVNSTQPLGQQGPNPASSSAGQGAQQMTPVSSSQVKEIGYDAAKQELYVSWHSGKTSVYSGVPALVHQDLLHAPSVGKSLNMTVKPRYPHRYVEDAGSGEIG
jgi:hypothetical protein